MKRMPIKLINDDMRSVLPLLLREHPNAVIITDPPYNKGFDYGIEYKDAMDSQAYISMLAIMRDIPSAIIMVAEDAMEYLAHAMGRPKRVNYVCLYKGPFPNQVLSVYYYHRAPDLNKVQVRVSEASRRVVNRIGGKVPWSKDVKIREWWQDIGVVRFDKEKHPCQLNLKLADRIVKIFTRPGDIVIDPFMGSGTTAIACLNNSRTFIGIEQSSKYCGAAENRIKKWKSENSILQLT